MSTTDLHILADALAFAFLFAMGGLIVYAVARSSWRRREVRSLLRVGAPSFAVAAFMLVGIAAWPDLREGVNDAVGVDLDERGEVIVPQDEVVEVAYEPPTPALRRSTTGHLAQAAREGTGDPTQPSDAASIGSGGGGSDGAGGGSGGGDGGDGGDGGAGDPLPTVDPSPSVEPSPTGEPSPTPEPSPTVDPSPTEDPPGPPGGGPPGPPGDPPGPPRVMMTLPGCHPDVC